MPVDRIVLKFLKPLPKYRSRPGLKDIHEMKVDKWTVWLSNTVYTRRVGMRTDSPRITVVMEQMSLETSDTAGLRFLNLVNLRTSRETKRLG
jgi:hypothetical protein